MTLPGMAPLMGGRRSQWGWFPFRCWDLEHPTGLAERWSHPQAPGRTKNQLFPGGRAARKPKAIFCWVTL